MKKKLYSGWGVGPKERTFTPTEYKNSYLKKNSGMLYDVYVAKKKSIEARQRRLRRRKIAHQETKRTGLFGLDLFDGWL